MEFSGKNALVTGGAGFIGSALARRLLSLGASVTIVDSLIPEYGGNLRNLADITERVKFSVSDMRDPHAMRHHVQGKDLVFNLAGQTSHMDSMSDPFTDLDINARSQLSMLETLRQCNPGAIVVFASTRQIYGRPSRLPVDEEHPIKPVDVNGINKVAGEQYHLLYNEVHGLRTSVLRLTNTYGPGMRIKDARQTFLGVWIRNAILGKPIEVWGGNQLRDFNFVDDVVDAFLCAASCEAANGHAYNLGSGEVVDLNVLAALVVDAAGGGIIENREFPADRRKIDIGDYYSDFSRFSGLTGWSPEVPLRDGIERTLRYFRQYLDDYL